MADNNDWAIIPVNTKPIPIKDITITNPADLAQIGRRIQHWSKMKQYSYGERLNPMIEYLKNCKETFLYKVNFDLIHLISDTLGIKDTKIELDLNTRENMSTGSIISHIVNSRGDTYLSGSSGPNYLTTQDLKEVNKICIQELKKDIPKYSVLHLIAEKKEPLKTLRNLGTWKEWSKPTLAA